MKQIPIPSLNTGEIYIGCIGYGTNMPYHIILLPDDNDNASWDDQMAWAKGIGGDLPNRSEMAMLWTNHRDQFQTDWYWTNELLLENREWAWYHYFDDGTQRINYWLDQFRAKAVRRVPFYS